MFEDQTKKPFIKKLLNHNIKFWAAVAAALIILIAGGASLYVKSALGRSIKTAKKRSTCISRKVRRFQRSLPN